MTENTVDSEKWRPTKTQILVSIALVSGIAMLNIVEHLPHHPVASLLALLLALVTGVTGVWAARRVEKKYRPIVLRERLERNAKRRQRREARQLKKQGDTAAE